VAMPACAWHWLWDQRKANTWEQLPARAGGTHRPWMGESSLEGRDSASLTSSTWGNPCLSM
jgi:hypothetical protein